MGFVDVLLFIFQRRVDERYFNGLLNDVAARYGG